LIKLEMIRDFQQSTEKLAQGGVAQRMLNDWAARRRKSWKNCALS